MDSSTRLFVIVGDLMHIGDAPRLKAFEMRHLTRIQCAGVISGKVMSNRRKAAISMYQN
jgi:hypothetical protein